MVDSLPREAIGSVLLADDSDDDVVLFRRAYRSAGFANPLYVVRGGEETVAYLKGEGEFSDRAEFPFPKLLLLDLKMPGRDGFAVLKWIRHEPAVKHLRVVVMTTAEESLAAKRAYQLGANSLVVKCHGTEEFVEQLREIQRHWLLP